VIPMYALLQNFFIAILVLSGVPLLASALVGGVLTIFQAATQLHEATVVHIARLITLLIVLFLGGSWGLQQITGLLQGSFMLARAFGGG